MRHPELLYVPTAMDIAKAIVSPQVVAQFKSDTLLAAQVAVLFGPPPPDRVFVLTAASISAIATGGQTVSIVRIRVLQFPGQVSSPPEIARIEPDPDPARVAMNFSGEVILMPGQQLQCAADFSAAAFVNTVQASVLGYMAPRANYELGVLV